MHSLWCRVNEMGVCALTLEALGLRAVDARSCRSSLYGLKAKPTGFVKNFIRMGQGLRASDKSEKRPEVHQTSGRFSSETIFNHSLDQEDIPGPAPGLRSPGVVHLRAIPELIAVLVSPLRFLIVKMKPDHIERS